MSGPPRRPGPGRGPRRPSGEGGRPRGFGLRPLGPDAFELTHPPCVRELWDDYEEGIEAWRAGEAEEARDILRFALEGCGDHAWIHVALGRLALELDRDTELARGHFGYVIELLRRTLPPGFRGTLPPDAPGNRPLFDAIEGLAGIARGAGRLGEADELEAWARSLRGDAPARGR